MFDPFLTVDDGGSGKKGPESGYNTDGHTALYLNEQRPEWNNYLRLGDLAAITIGGKQYYAFELDANEPGSTGKSLISLDNIRIYTSATDNTSLVQNDESNLDLLGTKRFALNDPLMSGSDYNTKNWIELDANQNQGNGGSGISDLIFYVPTTAFAGAKPTDFVWFYDLNGVNLAAQSGYEEWRAVLGPGAVPENGGTIFLVALGLIGLAAFRAKLAKS